MAKKNFPGQRVDESFVREMRELAKFRYLKNLAKKEPSLREMTELARRTDNWKNVKEELKTKPKKEDLKL